jgi:Ca-activated chloride channel family protein
VLLVSDGENPNIEGDDPQAAGMAEDLRRAGVEVLALGVGSAEGGTIPLPGGRVKRDDDGEVVVTRLDPSALGNIAGDDVFDLERDAIVQLDGRLDEIAGAGTSIERVPTAAERYQWPLAIALLLLVFDRIVANVVLRPRGHVGSPAAR